MNGEEPTAIEQLLQHIRRILINLLNRTTEFLSDTSDLRGVSISWSRLEELGVLDCELLDRLRESGFFSEGGAVYFAHVGAEQDTRSLVRERRA